MTEPSLGAVDPRHCSECPRTCTSRPPLFRCRPSVARNNTNLIQAQGKLHTQARQASYTNGTSFIHKRNKLHTHAHTSTELRPTNFPYTSPTLYKHKVSILHSRDKLHTRTHTSIEPEPRIVIHTKQALYKPKVNSDTHETSFIHGLIRTHRTIACTRSVPERTARAVFTCLFRSTTANMKPPLLHQDQPARPQLIAQSC